jgi:YidC/Oxa1 family membrane protein insertase
MSFFTWLFAPIVLAMELLLSAYTYILGSTGLAILLLSVTLTIALFPLQRKGVVLERRIAAKKQLIDSEVAAARKPGMSGQELFEVTERVYRKHHYHPIQEMLSGASFIVVLPILISSVILFMDSPHVAGQKFLFISDLGAPDGLLPGAINLLPILMFGVTTTDALVRFKNDARSRLRFLLISAVLLVLVYSMPAALVLYWLGNAVVSFLLARLFR